MEDELIDLIVEYLCTDHTKSELMVLVEKAIKLSNGEESILTLAAGRDPGR